MADDVHANVLGNLQALHLGDHGGPEAVEALPGLLAPAGHGIAWVDPCGFDHLDEIGAGPLLASQRPSGQPGKDRARL